MKVQCGYGTENLRSNNCTIKDGSFGVFLSNGWSILGSNTQDNITIQGITFTNVINPISTYSVTNITITDCLFEVRIVSCQCVA